MTKGYKIKFENIICNTNQFYINDQYKITISIVDLNNNISLDRVQPNARFALRCLQQSMEF